MESDTQTAQNGHEAPEADVTVAQAANTHEPVNTESAGQASESATPAEVETISLEEARKLRGENKSLRQRLRDAEAKSANADVETLSELEQASRDRDAYRTKYDALVESLKAERMTTAAVSAATKAGAIEAGAIARMISPAAVEWDDDLAPENVEALVSELKKAHPKLFAAAPGRGDGGTRDQMVPASVFGGDRIKAAYARKG